MDGKAELEALIRRGAGMKTRSVVCEPSTALGVLDSNIRAQQPASSRALPTSGMGSVVWPRTLRRDRPEELP